jgi:excisionase family DNA binding protein
MPDMTNDLLTLQEAAAILRIHTRTLTRWGKAGMIRLIKYPKGYRVERGEIERFKAEMARLTTLVMSEPPPEA